MKPPNVRCQGQTCLFTCPVLDVYKYTTFSFSKEQFSDSKKPKLQRKIFERKSNQELIFIHSKPFSYAFKYHLAFSSIVRMLACMGFAQHTSFGMFFTIIIHNQCFIYQSISLLTCMFLVHMLLYKIEIVCCFDLVLYFDSYIQVV